MELEQPLLSLENEEEHDNYHFPPNTTPINLKKREKDKQSNRRLRPTQAPLHGITKGENRRNDKKMAGAVTFVNKSGRSWQISTGILLVVSIGLLIALIVVASEKDSSSVRTLRVVDDSNAGTVCGAGSNPNNHSIDLTEPDNPGPFHDLTRDELIRLRTFLENDPGTNADKTNDSMGIASSYIYLADLWLPPKADVINYLDNGGQQPERQARVMMFRGDKSPPVVEEWICGPLSNITQCNLLNLMNRRNPIEFASRPFSGYEFMHIETQVLSQVEEKLGYLMKESYNASFAQSNDPMDKLTINPVPMSSALTGELSQRRIWIWFLYDIPFNLLHPTDMGVLLNLDGSNSSLWSVEKVWYSGSVYESMDDLDEKYRAGTINTTHPINPEQFKRPMLGESACQMCYSACSRWGKFSSINKTVLNKPVYSEDLYSTLHRRGDPMPPNPQRPPTLVEPDGKRYSLKGRKVDYMGWEFNFRMSAHAGPVIYDVRFKGERIAYEYALSEIAAFYSGNSPLSQSTDYVDSGAASGLGSKSLVPGADCPEIATLVDYVLMNQFKEEPGVYDAAFCLFEHNNGYPLRRHSQYMSNGFYGGMLDSVLTLRSALVVGNYDYLIDFIFHQNGALETRLMSTGYIQTNILRDVERLYGFQIENNILGNLHHHMFHLKADLDVGGTSNRYETLDIKPERTELSWDPNITYSQSMFTPTLKNTEMEALYKYNFDTPKDHIVHNNDERNKWGERKAYRIHLSGISKNLFEEGEGNEPVISWARHQLAVTRQKDDEMRSSSNYGMYDGKDPVVNFHRFYEDDEDIVDKDLVFWMTLGLHHIPHSEDLPVTPTAGNHLTAWLLPYNYFPECPSMGSRDAIYIGYKNRLKIKEGVTVNRYGNSRDSCTIPTPTLEEDVEANPDLVLESKRTVPAI